MNPFNKSRHFFDCLPNCEERTPWCHTYCDRYLKKRTELDTLNESERKRKNALAYTSRKKQSL